MTSDRIDSIRDHFPQLPFKQDVPLAPYTFMKVGGNAALFVEIASVDQLHELCAYCFTQGMDFVILGGVSNSVIPDAGLDKLVILNHADSIQFEETGTEIVTVIADSGVVTATLSNQTMQRGLTGLEHFVGVPGTVGGAVVNNSHFTAHELIGNFTTQVEVCTTEGKRKLWQKDALAFGYDSSIFHTNKAVVLRAYFTLYKGDAVHIQEKMLEAAKKRTSTQPIGVPSTGCMFKNPKITESQRQTIQSQVDIPTGALKEVDGNIQIAAGFLIDQAGMKGNSVGGAMVSDKHATYIVNTGNANSADIDALAAQVERTVYERFGVRLEREVFFLQ